MGRHDMRHTTSLHGWTLLQTIFAQRAAAALAWTLCALAAAHSSGATLVVSPASASDSSTNSISLRVASLTNGETVIVDQCLDLNRNNAWDSGDPIVRRFWLTDNVVPMIGGVTNVSVPGDTNKTLAAIGMSFDIPSSGFGQRIDGRQFFRLTSPAGRFAAVTTAFTVTSETAYAQTISGVVLSGGSNVPNAVVLLYPGRVLMGDPLAGTLTDAAGAYTLRVAPGTYGLLAWRSGYVADSLEAPVVTLGAGATAATNLNLLPATSTIAGRFVNAAVNGAAPAGMCVGGLSGDGLVSFGFTGANGDFSLPALPGLFGTWTLFGDDAMLQGFVRPPTLPRMDVSTGDVAGVTVTLTAGTAMVYGTVKDQANKPLAAEVSTADAGGHYIGASVADAGGNYAVAVLPGSNICATVVGVRGTNVGFVFSQSPRVSLAAGQSVRQALVARRAPLGVAGTVRDDLGNAVAGLAVRIAGTDGGGTNWVALDGRTDAGGAYAVPVASGTWQVSLPADGPNGLTALGCLPTPTRSVTVNAGTGSVDFVVSRPPVVLTTSAQPLEGGFVTGGGGCELLGWTKLAATPANGYAFLRWQDGDTQAVRTVQAVHAAAYVATFGQAVNVVAGVTPPAGGLVSGGGVYGVGGTATLTALAAAGYRFASWTDGGTNAVRTIMVLPGTAYTAVFVPVGTVVGVAAPGGAGMVTGGGQYDVGATATLAASATNAHALFSRWVDGATAATQAVRVAAGANVRTALFVTAVVITAAPVPPSGGTVTASPAPAGGALATGALYVSNAALTVTLTAVASPGWRLTDWSDGVTNVASRAVSLRSDTNVAARFVAQTKLLVLAAPANGGSVSGAGTYDAGAPATLRATAAAGWRFAAWSDGDTNATRVVAVPAADATYAATFVQRAQITVAAIPPLAGSVTGGGVYDVGGEAVLSAAVTNGHYRFKQWQDGSTLATRTISVRGAAVYTATFAAQGELVGMAVPAGGGTVFGGGTYDVGTTVTLAACSTNLDFVFSRWSDGVASTARVVTVAACSATQTALFATSVLVRAVAAPPEGGNVALSPAPLEGGEPAAGVKYARDAVRTITLTATPGRGWQWSGWSDGPQAAARSVGLATGAVYTAVFARKTVALTARASPSAGGSVTGGGVCPTWTNALICASSQPGYRFVRWEDGGTNPVREVALTWGDVVCTATFVAEAPVFGAAQPATAGFVGGGGTYDVGQTVALSACSTNAGFIFSRWADGLAATTRLWQVSAGTNVATALFVPAVTVHAAVAPAGAGALAISPLSPEGGSLDSGAKYASNSLQTVRLTAAASNLWRFVAWSDGFSNTPSRSVTLRTDTNLTAQFQRQAVLVATASPGIGGAALGGGVYDVGAMATLHAAPAAGWRFAGWSDGDTNAEHGVTVADGGGTYTARFLQQQRLLVVATPIAAGTCTGGGTYDAMSSVRITAVATNANYRFKQWSGGYPDNPLDVTLAQPLTTWTAQFVPGGTLAVRCQPPEAGRATGDGVYDVGTHVALTACSTNAGFVFSRWSDGATTTGRLWTVVQGTNNLCTALFATAVVMRAALSPAANGTLSVQPPPSEGGVLSNGVKYASNTTVTLTVTPAAGWRLTSWSDGASTSAVRALALASATNLTARLGAFATVTALANPSTKGVVTGGGAYNLGDMALLTAQPSTGCVFVCWQDGDDNLVRLVKVTTDTVYTACFERLITLTTGADPVGAGLASGGGVYREQSVVNLAAVSTNAAYVFARWGDGVTSVVRTVTVVAPTNFVASFTTTTVFSASLSVAPRARVIAVTPPLTGSTTSCMQGGTASGGAVYGAGAQVALTTQVEPADAGTVSGGGTYRTQSAVCLAATSTNTAYGFAHWQDGATSAVRTVTLSESTNFVATFVTPALAVRVNAWVARDDLPDGTELLAVHINQGQFSVAWNAQLLPADAPGATNDGSLALEYQAADADVTALAQALDAVINLDLDGNQELLSIRWYGGDAVAETPFEGWLRVEHPAAAPGAVPAVWRLVPAAP